MSEISLCTCVIRVGGDLNTVVRKGDFAPITWPEVEIMEHLHGSDAVSDVEVIDKDDTTIAEEFERLKLKYGKDVMEYLFPGKRPAMQLKAPDSIPRRQRIVPVPVGGEVDPFK